MYTAKAPKNYKDSELEGLDPLTAYHLRNGVMVAPSYVGETRVPEGLVVEDSRWICTYQYIEPGTLYISRIEWKSKKGELPISIFSLIKRLGKWVENVGITEVVFTPDISDTSERYIKFIWLLLSLGFVLTEGELGIVTLNLNLTGEETQLDKAVQEEL